MAEKRLLVVLLSLTIVHTTHSTSSEVQSPLDVAYIVNELNDLKDELESGLKDSESSPSRSGHFQYSQEVRGPAVKASQDFDKPVTDYSKDTGDELFNNQPDKYTSQANDYSTTYDLKPASLSASSSSVVQPLHHISSANSGSVQQVSNPVSFDKYPIQVPASLHELRYSDGFLEKYPVQPRKIVPGPYSGANVPYLQGPGGYREDDNIADKSADYSVHGNPNSNTDGSDRYDHTNVFNNNDLADVSPGVNTRPLTPQSYPLGTFSKIISRFLTPTPSDPRSTDGGHGVSKGNSNSVFLVGDYFSGSSAGKGAGDTSRFGGHGSGGGHHQRYDEGGQYAVFPQHGFIDHSSQWQCWPQFFLQYDHDFRGSVWQDVKGHVHVHQGRAVFEGQGFLAIPFFACNDLLPRYSMIFVIRPTYQAGPHPQAVLGNSVFSSQASLLVSVSGNTLTLVIRQRAANLTPGQLLAQCQTHHRTKCSVCGGVHYTGPGGAGPGFKSQQQSQVGHGYPGQSGEIAVLQLTISGEVMVTIAQENDWIFFGAGDQYVTSPGRLPTLTNEALYVGAGADPRGGDALAHYTGTFDSFLFEKCP